MNWTAVAYVIASGLLILSVMRASRKYDAMLIERKNRLNAQVGNESPGTDYDTRLPKFTPQTDWEHDADSGYDAAQVAREIQDYTEGKNVA